MQFPRQASAQSLVGRAGQGLGLCLDCQVASDVCFLCSVRRDCH